MIGPVAAQGMGAAFAFVNFGVPNLDSVLVVLGHFWMLRAILFLVREERFAVAAVVVSLDPPLCSSAAGRDRWIWPLRRSSSSLFAHR